MTDAVSENAMMHTAMFHAPAVFRGRAWTRLLRWQLICRKRLTPWKERVLQRVWQGMWTVQVVVETPETAHTWRGQVRQRAMQGRRFCSCLSSTYPDGSVL